MCVKKLELEVSSSSSPADCERWGSSLAPPPKVAASGQLHTFNLLQRIPQKALHLNKARIILFCS